MAAKTSSMEPVRLFIFFFTVGFSLVLYHGSGEAEAPPLHAV